MDDGFTTFMISISGVILLFMNWMSFFGWILIIIAVYTNMIYIARVVKQSQMHFIPIIMIFLSVLPLVLLFLVSPQMMASYEQTSIDVKILFNDALSFIPLHQDTVRIENITFLNDSNSTDDRQPGIIFR